MQRQHADLQHKRCKQRNKLYLDIANGSELCERHFANRHFHSSSGSQYLQQWNTECEGQQLWWFKFKQNHDAYRSIGTNSTGHYHWSELSNAEYSEQHLQRLQRCGHDLQLDSTCRLHHHTRPRHQHHQGNLGHSSRHCERNTQQWVWYFCRFYQIGKREALRRS